MEVASALLDASNNKGSKSPCDNNSHSSWLGGWLHPRYISLYFEWFVSKYFFFHGTISEAIRSRAGGRVEARGQMRGSV